MYIHDTDPVPRRPVRISIERLSSSQFTVWRDPTRKNRIRRIAGEWQAYRGESAADFGPRHATFARAVLFAMRFSRYPTEDVTVRDAHVCYLRDSVIGDNWLVIFHERGVRIFREQNLRDLDPMQESALCEIRAVAVKVRDRDLAHKSDPVDPA